MAGARSRPQALDDAGYTRETGRAIGPGVIVGNTLTGEHTRAVDAAALAVRPPGATAAAAAHGLSGAVRGRLAKTMEEVYKSVFAPVTEDTLAGGLSNTIAGRICNYFDFHGGGYTVDGACSSSLLAVCTAANLLPSGDLDMALAGGVDISLDTFELIGFAKNGALSPDEMRVYDKRGNGFIPGEGCGFVVLKRTGRRARRRRYVYAVHRGWGVSSDGKGGLTAPSREGQATDSSPRLRARRLRPRHARFHRRPRHRHARRRQGRAGGHRRRPGARRRRRRAACGVTSFKSIVGHTKAAAGVGGLHQGGDRGQSPRPAADRRLLPAQPGLRRHRPGALPHPARRDARRRTATCAPAFRRWASAASTLT